MAMTSHSTHAKALHSGSTLCDPVDYSPPGFSVLGILQARVLRGLPCPPPEDLPNLEMEPTSLTSLAPGGFFTTGTTQEAHNITLPQG